MKILRQFPNLVRAFAFKRLVATILAIGLLATIAPLGVSSHAQGCAMPCCSGGSCSTGACDASFGTPIKQTKSDSHCEHDSGSADVDVVAVTQSTEIDTSEFCGANHLSGLSLATQLQAAPLHPTTVKPGSFSKPCSSDCSGATVSSQLRRSREMANHGDTNEDLPHPSSLQSRNNQHPVFLSLQIRKLSPPRAPPAIPFNV